MRSVAGPRARARRAAPCRQRSTSSVDDHGCSTANVAYCVILSGAKDLGLLLVILSGAKDLGFHAEILRLAGSPQDDMPLCLRHPSLRSRTGAGSPHDEARALNSCVFSAAALSALSLPAVTSASILASISALIALATVATGTLCFCATAVSVMPASSVRSALASARPSALAATFSSSRVTLAILAPGLGPRSLRASLSACSNWSPLTPSLLAATSITARCCSAFDGAVWA